MRCFCGKFRLENSRQQLMTLLLLAGFLAALIPVPVSLVQLGYQKDRSEPFPCQDRPCACRSAAQCRKRCCCFTAEQKQAWGRRHGVKAFTVPMETLASKSRSVSDRREACCVSPTAAEPTSPRKEFGASTESKSGARRAPKPASRFKVVIGVFAQQCQGVAHSFAGVPIYIVPPRVELVTVVQQSFEQLILEQVLFEQGGLEPPVPPPRLAGVSFL